MRSEPFLYRSWVEVDTEQIVKNYKALSEVSKGKIIAVVKANAYGHGDRQVSLSLERNGADFFAVSNIKEGIRIRRAGVSGKILILGYTSPSLLYLLPKWGLIQTVVSEEHGEELMAKAPSDAEFHVAVNTGMNRIGISSENYDESIKIIRNMAKRLRISGIFTHLSAADSASPRDICFTNNSINNFFRIAEGVRSSQITDIHCMNSAGSLSYPDSRFNRVRLGISLYGYPPSGDVRLPLGVAPGLQWKTSVAKVFFVKAGERIGYGNGFTAEKNMKMATLMTGYADGYPRALSNKGRVLLNGEYADVVGRISMDMMTVDVSGIENVRCGDHAVLIGNSGNKKITAEELANKTGTITYEILTGISERAEREYL